jgi:cytochrome P450/NADPH-cytochrome P450 reductase
MVTNYPTEAVNRRLSILDILKSNQSINLPFAQYLTLLPPLKLRHYSISSSPLSNPNTCSLTYSVINAPGLSGLGQFHGVASTYLETLSPGDQILVSVRSTNKLFRPPVNPEETPIVMFCAGSGLAPFRGFVQERAIQIREGQRKLSPALLFTGCRGPAIDQLYEEESREWVSIGAVDVRYAYSRDSERSEGCKYIQDRMLHDKMDIYKMWDAGAKIYMCGSREVAQEIRAAAKKLVAEHASSKGKQWGDEEIENWLVEKKNERIVSDVFS